jgi:hypothetical protein
MIKMAEVKAAQAEDRVRSAPGILRAKGVRVVSRDRGRCLGVFYTATIKSGGSEPWAEGNLVPRQAVYWPVSNTWQGPWRRDGKSGHYFKGETLRALIWWLRTGELPEKEVAGRGES